MISHIIILLGHQQGLKLNDLVLIITGIATVIHRGIASWKELGEVEKAMAGKKKRAGTKGRGRP